MPSVRRCWDTSDKLDGNLRLRGAKPNYVRVEGDQSLQYNSLMAARHTPKTVPQKQISLEAQQHPLPWYNIFRSTHTKQHRPYPASRSSFHILSILHRECYTVQLFLVGDEPNIEQNLNEHMSTRLMKHALTSITRMMSSSSTAIPVGSSESVCSSMPRPSWAACAKWRTKTNCILLR